MAYIRIYLNDVLMDQIEFNEGTLTIGRDSKSDIVIDNAGVSSLHATIEKKAGSFILTDNDSTNGVFVNGDRIEQQTLKYRDEIQIYNYVLKFMAVGGLQDEADPDMAQDGKSDQALTMEVAISDVQDLLRLRAQKKQAYVELQTPKGGQSRFSLKAISFRIGKSRQCDLRTGGWFAPKFAAEIQRQADGYYLVPRKRGQVIINGKPAAETIKLVDGDSFYVRNLSMSFFHRIIDEPLAEGSSESK